MVALGGAIPAVPLILDGEGAIDWRAQRAVLRYYLASAADGLAVGVHTTQFELHDDLGALRAVWDLTREVVSTAGRPVTLVAGVCGDEADAVKEAAVASELGFDVALLCSRGMSEVTEDSVVAKADAVGEVLPTVAFYLQESVGGIYISPDCWRRLAELETLVGVKVAPFDRYRTREVARAVLESDRWQDVALLTGNDDTIVADLVTPHRLVVGGESRELRCAGGLLGQFAVGTKAAVELTHRALSVNGSVPEDLLALGSDLVEVNAAVFDVRHGFRGCVAGVNEVLRQQGIAAGSTCLSPVEKLSPGQSELVARVRFAHPWLLDETFVAENRDAWLG